MFAAERVEPSLHAQLAGPIVVLDECRVRSDADFAVWQAKIVIRVAVEEPPLLLPARLEKQTREPAVGDFMVDADSRVQIFAVRFLHARDAEEHRPRNVRRQRPVAVDAQGDTLRRHVAVVLEQHPARDARAVADPCLETRRDHGRLGFDTIGEGATVVDGNCHAAEHAFIAGQCAGEVELSAECIERTGLHRDACAKFRLRSSRHQVDEAAGAEP